MAAWQSWCDMNAATLQSKIYAGYGKAALRLGYTTDLYRPSSPDFPLSNKITSLPVSFNSQDMRYSKPNKYGPSPWFGVFDGTIARVGDYLTNTHDGTFFIAAMQQALPILVVQTNRIINILRPQQQTGVGALGYGGDTAANETALMSGWPASVLQGTKGGKGGANLPGDTQNPWWAILLPVFPGVILRSGDLITDDLQRRYAISSAELSDLGWRLTAAQVQT